MCMLSGFFGLLKLGSAAASFFFLANANTHTHTQRMFIYYIITRLNYVYIYNISIIPIDILDKQETYEMLSNMKVQPHKISRQTSGSIGLKW